MKYMKRELEAIEMQCSSSWKGTRKGTLETKTASKMFLQMQNHLNQTANSSEPAQTGMMQVVTLIHNNEPMAQPSFHTWHTGILTKLVRCIREL